MFQSPKPEQSVMQALESLNEQQVSFSICEYILHRYDQGQTPVRLVFDNIFCSGNRHNLQVGKKGNRSNYGFTFSTRVCHSTFTIATKFCFYKKNFRSVISLAGEMRGRVCESKS